MTTPELLPLAPLSLRIYTIILRILHNRLVLASELESHSVLLECFHPSAKLTEPPYFCSYRGTDGLKRYDELAEDDTNLAKRLGEMRGIYSRFRPYRRELERGDRRVKKLDGDSSGRTIAGTAGDGFEGDPVKQILSLEGHELFTQLVSQTNLVKLGPRHGLFTCFVPVEEGVVRVWRDWLQDMAAGNRNKNHDQAEIVEELGTQKGKEKVVDQENSTDPKAVGNQSIIWIGPNKNTGISLTVREKKYRRDIPILVRTDEEDMPVSYEIEFDGVYSDPPPLINCVDAVRTTYPHFALTFDVGEVLGPRGQLFWKSRRFWLFRLKIRIRLDQIL